MKKLLFSAVLFCSVALSLESKAQAFNEGDVVVSAGYGIPLVKGNWLKAYEAADATFDYYGHDPIYVKFEYGINDDWGIGLSYFNSSFGFKQSYSETTYDAFGNAIGTAVYVDDINLSAQAVNIRLNRHIAVSKKFDMYWGFGGGPKFSKLSYSSTNPSNVNESMKLNPIAFELTYGGRYYFTDNIGVYGEIGIARSYLQLGLCAKF